MTIAQIVGTVALVLTFAILAIGLLRLARSDK